MEHVPAGRTIRQLRADMVSSIRHLECRTRSGCALPYTKEQVENLFANISTLMYFIEATHDNETPSEEVQTTQEQEVTKHKDISERIKSLRPNAVCKATLIQLRMTPTTSNEPTPTNNNQPCGLAEPGQQDQTERAEELREFRQQQNIDPLTQPWRQSIRNSSGNFNVSFDPNAFPQLSFPQSQHRSETRDDRTRNNNINTSHRIAPPPTYPSSSTFRQQRNETLPGFSSINSNFNHHFAEESLGGRRTDESFLSHSAALLDPEEGEGIPTTDEMVNPTTRAVSEQRQHRWRKFKTSTDIVPKFDGDPLNFLLFARVFYEEVASNPELTIVTKFAELHRCLNSKTAQTIFSGVSPGLRGYRFVWTRLYDTYWSKHRLLEAAQTRLQKKKKVKNSRDVDELMELCSTGQAIYTSLIACGVAKNLVDRELMEEIGRRCPDQLINEFFLFDDGKVESVAHLLDFIEARARAARNENRILGPPPWSSTHSKTLNSGGRVRGDDTLITDDEYSIAVIAERNTATSNEKAHSNKFAAYKQRSCLLCGQQPHRSYNCPIGTVESRKQKLMQLNRCLKCFWDGHKANTCPRQVRCFTCGEDTHPTTLCNKEVNLAAISLFEDAEPPGAEEVSTF